MATSANEFAASVSPGGQWLAYDSDESGRLAVYVRDLIGSGGRWQVTPTGAEEPHWSADGRELYYRSANGLMVVPISRGVSFQAGNPRPLFDSMYSTGIESGRSYDTDPNSGRFLLVSPVTAGPTAGVVRVVLN